jgi:phosphatidylserine synthase
VAAAAAGVALHLAAPAAARLPLFDTPEAAYGPAAALVAALLLAVLRRAPQTQSSPWEAVVNGAQGALAALLVSNLTFPSLTSISGTGTIGLLLAICLVAPWVSRRARAAQPPPAAATPALAGAS